MTGYSDNKHTHNIPRCTAQLGSRMTGGITKAGLGLLFATSLVLTACDTKQADAPDKPAAEVSSDSDATLVISTDAEATIKEFEAEFIHQMLNLQQSQQAEYEALQAADAPDMDLESVNMAPDESNRATDLEGDAASSDFNTESEANTNAENLDESKQEGTESRAAVTLQDLPLATNVVLVEPKMLTAQEISNRYNTAMQSLYLPEDLPLPAQAVETLLNIATLTPKVFSNQELAQRLVIKSPALARFLKQYQAWEQAEIKHSEEVEAMKQSQLEEQQKQDEDLDALTREFTAKIEEYDKQIAKYEKMLEEIDANN